MHKYQTVIMCGDETLKCCRPVASLPDRLQSRVVTEEGAAMTNEEDAQKLSNVLLVLYKQRWRLKGRNGSTWTRGRGLWSFCQWR